MIIQINGGEKDEGKQTYSVLTSAAVPFLDMDQYEKTYPKNPKDRPYGVSNYFKSNLNYN